MKERMKNQKGITLIALIITIVVLMILAAVAINSITNDGILSQAGSTANQYTQEQLREQIILQDYEDMLTLANGGTFKEYSVGQEVTIGAESFYVIKDSAKTEAKVVLLAKQNINTNTLLQDEDANTIAFSETYYWKDDFTSSPYDLTETGVPDESHYAARAAYDYGLKIGGKGRLMIYIEADDLSKTDFFEKLSEGNYWLGSATPTNRAWAIAAYDSGSGVQIMNNGTFDNDYSFGVRPVVEISKSKLS